MTLAPIESEAFVLHVRPYRETSAIVTFFTKTEGRMAMMSKGCRRARSALKGILQPFQQLSLQWRAKATLPLLLEADLMALLCPTSQLGRLSGFYLNELLYRLLPEHEHQEALFEQYAHTVRQLDTPAMERGLRAFELQLLKGLGYGLDCARDVSGQEIRPERAYAYHPGQGLQWVPAADPLQTFQGTSILALAQNALQSEHLLDAKRLLKRALALPLNGRALNTRALLRSWMYEKNSSGR